MALPFGAVIFLIIVVTIVQVPPDVRPPCNYVNDILAPAASGNSSPIQSLAFGTPIAHPYPPLPNTEKNYALLQQLSDFERFSHCLHASNNLMDLVLKGAVIVAGLLTTLASAFRFQVAGVVFGAVVTSLAAFQRSFPFSAHAILYDGVTVQMDRLISDVQFAQGTPDTERVRREFLTVKADLAAALAGSTAGVAARTPSPTSNNPSATPSPTPG